MDITTTYWATVDSGTKIFGGLTFMFRDAKIIRDVEKEKKKLISNRDLVQENVEATHKTEKVNDAVFEWPKEVEKLIQEEEDMKTGLEHEQEISKDINCFLAGVLCVGHQMHHEMYREMLMKFKSLNAKCKFEPFSSSIPGLEHFSSSGNFVCFESIKVASDQLLEALQDGNNCNKIGLYGKRGSSKTEPVKAVGEKAKYLKIFDAVLFVTMTQNPNVVKMIQDQIADTLNIKLDNNIEAARKIKMRLEGMDRILVILDDVRAKLELDDIGIPYGSSNKCKVKVLLTTLSRRECALMKCQREIPLGPLSKEEAWTLLKLHSGTDDDGSSSFDSNLLSVAQQAVLEREGLPGTIKDVGSSLKRKKHIEEWKSTLDSLRHSMARYHVFRRRYSLLFHGFSLPCFVPGGGIQDLHG